MPHVLPRDQWNVTDPCSFSGVVRLAAIPQHPGSTEDEGLHPLNTERLDHFLFSPTEGLLPAHSWTTDF